MSAALPIEIDPSVAAIDALEARMAPSSSEREARCGALHLRVWSTSQPNSIVDRWCAELSERDHHGNVLRTAARIGYQPWDTRARVVEDVCAVARRWFVRDEEPETDDTAHIRAVRHIEDNGGLGAQFVQRYAEGRDL